MWGWGGCAAVEIDPSTISGEPRFCGTRIPVAALFENLASGASIEDFLRWFQGVTVGQVRDVLSFAAVSSLASAA